MRLFAGIDMPPPVKDAMAGLIEKLRPQAADAKWVPRDNLHVTLSFLGEVVEDRLGEIGGALTEAAKAVTGPIPTAVQGSGAFPSPRRARVMWVGLKDGEGRLATLAEEVATSLEPLGFPREKRAWAAHLTLARFRAPANVAPLLEEPVPNLPFEVPQVTLFRSRLARPAPTYEALHGFRFSERSAHAP